MGAIFDKLIDVEAERQFVQLFISRYGRKYYAEIADIISADVFSDKFNRDVWRAIVALEEKGDEVNLLSIYTEMRHAGVEVNIAQLTEVDSNAVELRVEDAIYLRDLSDRRKLYVQLTNAANKIADLSTPIESHLQGVREVTEAIATAEKGDVTLATMMGGLLEAVQQRMTGEEQAGWRSGFSIIDEVGALQPSDLDVIAGESSQGKTAFALNVALHAAKQGVPVAIYSLEMGAEQLASRLACIESESLPSTTIQYKRLSADEFGRLYSDVMKMCNYPMYFNFRSNHELPSLEQSIRRMCLNYGIKVVVVDYLQLLSAGDGVDRPGELAKITRRLKNLAKDLGICIILLSQLNRGDSSNPVPTIKRLRGSGEIEEAADNIYMVYRAERYGKEWPGGWRMYTTRNKALIFRGKSRNGGTGERLLDFVPEFTKFKDTNDRPLEGCDVRASATYDDSPFG